MVPLADLLDHSDQDANCHLSFDSPDTHEDVGDGLTEEGDDCKVGCCRFSLSIG